MNDAAVELEGDAELSEAAFETALEEALGPGFNTDTEDELKTRLSLDAPAIKPWTPPYSEALELERLFGGPARGLMLDEDERHDEHTSQRLRRLPAALRGILRSLKSDYRKRELLQRIEQTARARANRSLFREVEIPGVLETEYYLPEIHRRAELERLASDPAFRRDLEEHLATIKEQGHLVRLFASWPRPLPQFPDCPVSMASLWETESWMGLADSAMPESLPEEAVVALAQRAWHRLAHGRRYTLGTPEPRLLHWGALNSTFTIALMACAPGPWTASVDEIDTVGQPQSIPWVRSRLPTLTQPGPYDYAIVHLPPPGEGANNFRNRYKNLPSPVVDELSLADLGRLGPRKWRKRARTLLKEIVAHLSASAEVALIVPTSVRIIERAGRYPRWAYEKRESLAEGFGVLLESLGWRLQQKIDIVEINPLQQPLFETRRCTWQLILAERANEEAGERDDLEGWDLGTDVTLG